MKRILISACVLVCMLAVAPVMAQDKVKEKEDKTKVKDGDSKMKVKDDKVKMKGQDANMMLPYKVDYSSNFALGNPAHVKLVLEAWKDWDMNMLERTDFMADTIEWQLPDGSVTKGKAINLANGKKYRSGFTSVVSTIDAVVALKSTDKNENWVAVWGTEADTTPEGKVEKKEIHEIWRINKDGKVDFVKQYTSQPHPRQ